MIIDKRTKRVECNTPFTKRCRAIDQILENRIRIDVDKLRILRIAVELINQSSEFAVEDLIRAVDSLHAGTSIRAVLRQRIRAAPDLPYSDQSKLPSSIIVQLLYQEKQNK